MEEVITPRGKPKEHRKSIISRVDDIDLSPEYARKDAFIKQKDFISYLKRLEQRVAADTSNRVTLKKGRTLKKEAIIDEKGIEALIFKGDAILNADNPEAQKTTETELHNKSFEDKMKTLYHMLEVLKAKDPAGFMEVVEAFHRNREYYEGALKESKTRQLMI